MISDDSFGLEVMNDVTDLFEHDVDVRNHRFVGDAHSGVALEEEDIVSLAILVVLQLLPMTGTIEFDDEPAFFPQQVDGTQRSEDLHGMIPTKQRTEFVVRREVLGQMILDLALRMRPAEDGLDDHAGPR